ncbi:MaoC family dehydratase [Streptomyces prunicolor]|uniref:MaoC family dehydratase n=1 Tax=Streptomyces prunicolor TaxID=67348 RepID=UPI0038703A05|nr:MaoC family dehydratase [Streptomyces prunicolor]
MSATESAPAGLTLDLEGLAAHVGEHFGYTQWRTLTQEQVGQFADLTEDHNPIHVDPDHARTTPFGTTIVHGYFTVAMLAPFLQELVPVRGAALSVNYGIDKLRFPAPVPVGARFRCGAELAEVTEVKGGVQMKVVATVEVENAPKPALVAECLFRHYS